MAHLYTPSPAKPMSDVNAVSRDMVRDALKEYLREEGFRQMVSVEHAQLGGANQHTQVGEVASILRDQSKHFLHYERYELQQQHAYASPSHHQYPQDPYGLLNSNQAQIQFPSSRYGQQNPYQDQLEWFHAMDESADSRQGQDQGPRFQEQATQPFPQFTYTDRSRSHSVDPDPQFLQDTTMDSESMSDDDFEAMMAEPCEA